MPLVHFIILLFWTKATLSDNSGLEPTEKSADECIRYRRAWHLLSEAEKQFTLEGMLSLRNADNLEGDVVVQIAGEHFWHYTGLIIHQSSANMFWHGYLVWELESRIRMVDEKYACFSMPYWDYTVDYGRESELSVIGSVFGGDGDPDDNYKVNGFSWDVSVKEWFVAAESYCVAEDDDYPMCSLKRKIIKDGDFTLVPSPEEERELYKLKNFVDFSKHNIAKIPSILSGGVRRNDEHIFYATISGKAQAYEPLWWMFHSFIQYQLTMWISCNGYDQIPVEDLQDDSDPYTAYCGGEGTFITDVTDCRYDFSKYLRKRLGKAYRTLYSFNFRLDASLKYHVLESLSWPYVANNEVTVRDLYDISKWNVKYELGTYYDMIRLKDICVSEINQNWFTDVVSINHARNNKDAIYEVVVDDKVVSSKKKHGIDLSRICAAISLAVVLVAFYYYRSNSKGYQLINEQHGITV